MLAENDGWEMGYEILAGYKSPPAQTARLDEFYSASDPDSHAIKGAKIAPYQVIDKRSVVGQLQDLGVQPIVLSRKSVVRTAISQARRGQLAAREKAAGRAPVQNRREDIPSLGPTKIDPNVFLNFLEINRREYFELDFMASQFPDAYYLSYEELLKSPKDALAELGRALGLPIVYRGDGPIKKNTSADLQLDVLNLDELKDVALANGFEFDE